MNEKRFEIFKTFYNKLWHFQEEGITAIAIYREIKELSSLFSSKEAGVKLVEQWGIDFSSSTRLFLEKNPHCRKFILAVTEELIRLQSATDFDRERLHSQSHRLYGAVFDMLKTYGFQEERLSDEVWNFVAVKTSKMVADFGNAQFAKSFVGAMLEELDACEEEKGKIAVPPPLEKQIMELA